MKLILVAAFAALLFSCNQHGHTHDEANFDIASVKAHIIEMNKSYSKRFVTNDTTFYVDRYCKDAEVYCPSVPAVKGRDSIRAFFYAGGNNNEAVIELPTGNIYGDADLVVEEGAYNFPDGKGGSVDRGKFIALWKQEDGKWKLFREIWNTDLPPAPSK